MISLFSQNKVNALFWHCAQRRMVVS